MARLSAVLIEDDKVLAQFIAVQLREAELSVDHCDSLAAGIERLESGADIVLLDLLLPDARDLEGLRAIRRRFPHIAVIVITGLGDDLAEEALREGAQDYLTKPFSAGPWLLKHLRFAVIRHEVSRSYSPLVETLESAKRTAQQAKESSQAMGPTI